MPTDKATRHLRALEVVIRACVVAWAVLLMVPWSPSPFSLGLSDGAYEIFSHIAFAEGGSWGAGTLHTGGPLAFLRFPVFHQATWPLLLAGDAFVSAGSALLIDEIARRRLNAWGRLLFVLVLVAVLSIADEAIWVIALLLSQLLIPELPTSARWSLPPHRTWLAWPFVLNLAVCALVANVKGTYLLMAVVLAVQLAGLELLARRVPVIALGFITMIALLAQLSGLGLTDWPPYARHIIDSIGGYSESFAVAAPGHRPALLLTSVLLMLAVLTFGGRPVSWRPEALLRRAGLVALVWLVTKVALVRQDWFHEIRTFASLAVFFACAVLLQAPRWGRTARAIAVVPAAGLAILLALAADGPPALERSLHDFSSFLRHGMSGPRSRDAAARVEAAARVRAPWPPTSTVGVFGTHQSLLLGHPGRWVPLPIAAPYEIWTPWTSRRERDFLMGPGAPEYLVYTTSPASAEVAVTLTARYQEVAVGPHYRLLRRRSDPLPVTRRVVFDGAVSASERIALAPEWRGRPLVAEIEYTRNAVAQLTSALYQPPEAFLVLFQGNDVHTKIRMNGLLSAEGIALADTPGVWDGQPAALHGIRYGLLTGEPVRATAIGFEANGVAGRHWNRYFAATLRVRLYIPEFGGDPGMRQ